jgi:D-alanine-D-alanine ligase-like ATP-grasp enzyme
MAREIQAKLKQFEKVHYSLDFMFSVDKKPIFIEINSTPGFDLLRLVGSPALRERHAEKLLSLFY